jgi:uncharacterized protein
MSLLPPGLPLSTIIILAVTALVAGMARGFSGFGAALIFVPLAARFLGPQAAAPLLLLADGVVAIPMIRSAWPLARKREVAFMALGGVVGIPLGTWVLAHGDPLLLRWAIVALVVLMLVLLLSGWRYAGKPHDSVTVGVGVLSGLFSGIAQLAGPPVVAYWLGGAHDHRQMRASTILYFACGTAIGFFSYYASGLLTFDILKLSLLMAPFFAAGLWLGSKVFLLANAETFRRICLGLIGLSLLLSLPVWG